MINVLFIDDEPMIREQAKIYLEKYNDGIVIDACSSTKELLEKMETRIYDIVVSDYRMPDMDGITLLKKIREDGKEIPFIILTGAGSEEVAMKALNNGANRYLMKGGNPKLKYEILTRAIVDEVERAETKAKLKELNKIKEDFISATAHELRTPLVPIKIYSEYLRKGKLGEINDEQKSRLDEMLKATERLSKTIQEMLDVSRLSIGETYYDMKKTSLLDLVEEAVDQIEIVASERGITVKKDFISDIEDEDNNLYVQGDRDFLVMALKNLLDNATKYSNEGDDVKINGTINEDDIQICVEDEGVGIPDGDLDDIFKEYYIAGDQLTRERSKGVGLGLFIVKKIVEDHDGKVWVESEKGKGSKFYITLPLVRE